MICIIKIILLVGLFVFCCHIYSYDTESFTVNDNNTDNDKNTNINKYLQNWLKHNGTNLYKK